MFLTMNGNATFDENGRETISIFPKKTQKTRFFDFFQKTQKNSQDRFGPKKTSITAFFDIFFEFTAFTIREKTFSKKSDFFS
jgi:hypothetical protein